MALAFGALSWSFQRSRHQGRDRRPAAWASFWRSSTVTRLSPTALRSSHPSKAFEIKATSVGGLFHFKCHLLALLRRPIPEVAPFDGRFGRQVDVLSRFDARADVSQFALVPANRSSIKALQRTRPFDDVDRDRATGRASRRHYPPCGRDRRSRGSLRSHAGRRANISGKTVPRSSRTPVPSPAIPCRARPGIICHCRKATRSARRL